MSLYRDINSCFSAHPYCAVASHIAGGLGITTLILSLSPLDNALNTMLSLVASISVGVFKERVLDKKADNSDIFTWGVGSVIGIILHGFVW